MSSGYFPTYFTGRNEIVDVKLNYVTQENFKNLTKVDTSDFALKTNVAETKSRVNDIDVGKIYIIDELQGKNFVEDSYLFFDPDYRYFETTGIKSALSWNSTGLFDEKIKSIEDDYSPKLGFNNVRICLNVRSDVLVQEKVTYTHEHIVNVYIVYSISDITYASAPDIIKHCLFGSTIYNKKKWSGYGVAFGKQPYTHKDGKKAKNLIILGADLSDSSDDETKKIMP